MGKISDIWVRLGLKKDGFDKGIKSAEKSAQGFGTKLKDMKAGAVAVWAAIGTAVIGFAKGVITATNSTGDAWDRFIAGSKAGWQSFLQTLSSWNWDNWIGRIREATAAAKELQNAKDAEFEISNSIKLQKAAMAEELASLEILARNVTKPYEVRAQAAQEYLSKVKTIYDQELALANKLLSAQQGAWLAGTGLADTQQTRDDLTKFLVDIGKDDNMMNVLSGYASAQKIIDKGPGVFGSRYKKMDAAYTQRGQLADDLAALQAEYQTDLLQLYNAYEKLRSDAESGPLVDAIIKAGEAKAAFDKETKRMQQALNQSLNGAAGSGDDESTNSLPDILQIMDNSLQMAFDEIDAMADDFSDIEIGIEVDDSSFDALVEKARETAEAYRAEMERIAELNGMLEGSIVAAMSGGMQAITDMLMGVEGADASGVMSALLQPFADTAIQLGEMLIAQGLAISAFKKSLETLSGPAAIAAGTALLAIGSAMRSGIQALARGGSSASSTGTYVGESASSNVKDINTEMTVYVEGRISGSDIVLSGSRTMDKWRR